MNLMIISPGRRVDIVEYFKKEFHKRSGSIFTLDMMPYAAALYSGDKYFVINKDFNDLKAYVLDIIYICKNNNVDAVLSLVDPELEMLAEYRDLFIQNNILPIVSLKEEACFTFDKYLFFQTMEGRLPVLPTFDNIDEVKKNLLKGRIKYPLFAKPRKGSGSAGIARIENVEQLNKYQDIRDFIYQPFGKSKEYGVDIYFDMKSHKIVNYFIKEKIAMRSGETDKAISVTVPEIEKIVMSLEQFNFFGPIDMDVFEDENHNFYINEINPRFGGGYPHAYNCGVDFIKYIAENLAGNENKPELGTYQRGIVMMKYNGLFFCKDTDLAEKTVLNNPSGEGILV